MSDFLQVNIEGMSSDDVKKITLIASTHLREAESIIEIKNIGLDQVQIDVGIIINRRSGSGRTLTVERIAGSWTVTEVKGWYA